jgi:CDP-glycerol glycerophosphotransferase (TagB/SpsB family)
VTELALSEAVPLAHAAVDRLARDHDVRVLFIKGPTAVAQGLRAERVSLDVDALVDPARREVLADALTELGWLDENPYTSPTVLPMHSLTHRHPSWPCELDLHDRFPGFFADPQDVFEHLWTRRSTVDVAGHQITCTDRSAQALVLALHALRDPHDPTKAGELGDLVGRVSGGFTDDDLRDLAKLASELGAADTASSFVAAVGAAPVGLGSTRPEDLRAWRLRTQPTRATAVSWVDTLQHLPKRSWPRYLWYAATLSDTEMRLANPGLAPGRLALLRARGRRLRRGLRALPQAVRHVRALEQSPMTPVLEPRVAVRLDDTRGTGWGRWGVGLLDVVLPRKRGIVVRTFPDYDDQGLEVTRALSAEGVGPVTWLVAGQDIRWDLGATGEVAVLPARSLRGVLAFARARVVVHTHGLYQVPPRSRRKTFVNLWHGMPVKRLDPGPPVAHRQTDVLTVTSPLHGDHVQATWDLPASAVEIAGLPRNDRMLRAADEPLPGPLAELTSGRPLVVWLPTYRQSVTGDIRLDGHAFGNEFEFPGADAASVSALAERMGIHLLVKLHPMAPGAVTGRFGALTIWDESSLAEAGLTLYQVLGHAAALVTDHSSVWVDYLLVDRPVVFSIADLQQYADTRGHYFVPLADHLPGPVAADLVQLGSQLAEALDTDPWADRRRELRGRHHTHLDARSSARVAALIREQVGAERHGRPS